MTRYSAIFAKRCAFIGARKSKDCVRAYESAWLFLLCADYTETVWICLVEQSLIFVSDLAGHGTRFGDPRL